VTGPSDWVYGCIEDLVDAKLIACAHAFPIKSRYWWRNLVREANETRAAMHAPEVGSQALMDRIETMHPYEVPCILLTPLAGVSSLYLQWIHDSVVSSGDIET